MGAFGAALAARDLHLDKSQLLGREALDRFSHTARPATCGLCTNHCSLPVKGVDGGGGASSPATGAPVLWGRSPAICPT